MKLLRYACVIALGSSACGSHGNSARDAAMDAGSDAPADSGPCPSSRFFTGELVDWDSGNAGFCGIFGATFQVRGDPTRMFSTNPNGRFELCLASAAPTTIDIVPPTAASQCTTPPSSYTMPGLTVADPAVIASGHIISMRDFTVDRTTRLGVTLDPAKAHVFVHVELTPQPVQISNAHDAAQAFDGTTWSTGTTGSNVFFPNVDPTGGTTSVTMTGGAIGTGSVPLEAGKITYVTLVGQ